MSRRHRQEVEKNYEPQQVESQGGGHPEKSRWSLGLSSVKKEFFGRMDFFCVEKIASALCAAFERKEIEVDEHWFKIPRKLFESFPQPKIKADFDNEEASNKKAEKGRPKIKRLFNCITDNKVVDLFKETLSAVKKEVVKLYKDITQYTVCFFKGSNQVFAPEDNPYGKLSHFHRVLDNEIDELPSRKTISHYWNWFIDWKPVKGVEENPKDKREKNKHRLWENLIEWIIDHLLKVVPQYTYA